MQSSNAVVDQAFDALEETARIVRGEQSEAKVTKKKNAAYWHAMLFSAISKNPTKLQAVRQRLEQWILDDMDQCIPVMLGLKTSVSQKQQQKLLTNSNNSEVASSIILTADDKKEQDLTEEEIRAKEEALVRNAALVDEAAIQRICDSFTAYKQIAFAATVIFEAVGSSKTGKIDITKMMLRGYREKIFTEVRGALLKYILHHVTLCRRQEELFPTGGGLLKKACRMFATVAQQYENKDERIRFYDRVFVRKYHEHALAEARIHLFDFLRQPQALDNLLTWSEERISFELELVELFLHVDDGSTDVNSPFAQSRFRRQLQSVFIVPRLSDVIEHPFHGFLANLESGKWDKLKQQFSWSTQERDRVPTAAECCVDALRFYAEKRTKQVISSFNDQVFESTAAAATSFVSGLYEVLRLLFVDLISKFADEGATATLQRPIRKDISKALTNAHLKRKAQTPGGKGVHHEVDDHFADLLCIYIDLVLKDSKLLPPDQDLPAFCRTQVSELFLVLEDRDIFAEHYRLRLSKRLLQTTWEEDNERAVLEVLQRQVGKLYTHKFEGMIFDIQGAQSMLELFAEKQQQQQQQQQQISVRAAMTGENANDDNSGICAAGGKNDRLFEPKILTAAYWPTLKRDEDFVTPTNLQEQIESFERFYRQRFPTRQLRWQAERGTCQLNIMFPKGTREVACSIYQATIMIVIDTHTGGITLSDVSKKAGIEIKELKPLVASMLLARGLNLLRTRGTDREKVSESNPMNAKFGEAEIFDMNPDFTCRMRKLKLPSAITARSVASDTVGQSLIDASRGQMLDAAIVRIMKSRKQMRQSDLVDLVVNQVSKFFLPQPRDIKHRIEFLIQKEFLERDDDESDVFRYLA